MLVGDRGPRNIKSRKSGINSPINIWGKAASSKPQFSHKVAELSYIFERNSAIYHRHLHCRDNVVISPSRIEKYSSIPESTNGILNCSCSINIYQTVQILLQGNLIMHETLLLLLLSCSCSKKHQLYI